VRSSKRTYFWMGASVFFLGALIVAALVLPRSFELTAFSDVIQCFLLISGTAVFVPLASRSHGRVRLFWSLITMGVAFWLVYQIYWTSYEIVLRRDVPDLCTWDVILFLHVVPLMAALALRPHVSPDEYAARIGQLDFALLLVWWVYLYVLIVLPWQYVVPNITAYNRNLNLLYSVEKVALLAALVVCWSISKGHWRRLYAALFAMSLCYSAGSTLANWAIGHKTYYSGSLYDIPLVAAMASLTWIGLLTKAESPQVSKSSSTVYGVWVARLSMIATFTLPLFGAWSVSSHLIPSRIRMFRLGLTLCAAFFMGVMVFIRQRILDRELGRLLNHSRESFDSLKRLQAQILQSEKSASITQLIGGAAHELNNPITAMLGYSDLLLSTLLTPEQQPVAAKIGLYVRRTRSLVASLISFARQSPSTRSPLDLNTVARTALKLTQAQWESLNIEIRTELDNSLPRVLGDSNQLLQVCLQLVASSLHVQSERHGRLLLVSSSLLDGNCILQITIDVDHRAGNDVSGWHGKYGDGLGLSACRGILQEYGGILTCDERADGAILLRVELPALPAAPPKPVDATVPVLWRSQPSV
jgi:signal transduction histidine kinase